MLGRKAKKDTKAAKSGDKSTESAGKRLFSRPAMIVLALVAVAFMIYAMVSIIDIQSKIRERRRDLEEIKTKISIQEIKNEEMQKLYESTGTDFSALAEQIARDDLDYVKQGERIFVNVSGD